MNLESSLRIRWGQYYTVHTARPIHPFAKTIYKEQHDGETRLRDSGVTMVET